MLKYLHLAKLRIQERTAYSAWYWAGTVSAVMRLLIIYYFWQAVYESRSSIENIDLSTMLTYIVVAMLLQSLVGGGVGHELADNIKNGNVGIELLRPYDLIYKMFSLEAGAKITSIFQGTLPVLVVAYFYIGLNYPLSFETVVLFIISVFFGIWIGTFFDFLVGILAFWTVNIWGIRVLKESMITFFSGALIPLSLFPDWLRTVTEFLPFQAMVYLPVSIYTGLITGVDAYIAIGIQLFWIVFLYALVRILWAQALKQITIFGG